MSKTVEKSIFYYRPKPGDIWELNIPGKRKKIKVVSHLTRIRYRAKDGGRLLLPTVHWRRPLFKGRYSSMIRVKWLLQYGKLLKRG